MNNDQADLLIANFTRPEDAEDALKQIESVLKLTERKLQKGVLVQRAADGTLSVRDLRDTGFRDIVGSAMDLTMYIGTGTAKIALSTTRATAQLLLSSGSHILGLTGAFASYPLKKLRSTLRSDEQAKAIGAELTTGAVALALVVDPESRAAVQDIIVATGGALPERVGPTTGGAGASADVAHNGV